VSTEDDLDLFAVDTGSGDPDGIDALPASARRIELFVNFHAVFSDRLDDCTVGKPDRATRSLSR
jgi:hypothetical protein